MTTTGTRSGLPPYVDALMAGDRVALRRILSDADGYLQQMATNAADSASESATQAINSSNSAQASAASATAAAGSESQTQDLYNRVYALMVSFSRTWYGELPSDPTTDPNGNPPIAGAAYFNTTLEKLRIYDGNEWQDYDEESEQLSQQCAVNAAYAAQSASNAKTSATNAAASATAAAGSASAASGSAGDASNSAGAAASSATAAAGSASAASNSAGAAAQSASDAKSSATDSSNSANAAAGSASAANDSANSASGSASAASNSAGSAAQSASNASGSAGAAASSASSAGDSANAAAGSANTAQQYANQIVPIYDTLTALFPPLRANYFPQVNAAGTAYQMTNLAAIYVPLSGNCTITGPMTFGSTVQFNGTITGNASSSYWG